MTDFSPRLRAITRIKGRFSGLALEFLLMLAVCALLYHLAQPLGQAQSLGTRYSNPSVLREWRAAFLLQNAGMVLAWLGGLGWLALQLARSGDSKGKGSRTALAFALWAALAYWLQPFGLDATLWAATAMILMLVAGVGVWFEGRPLPSQGTSILTPLTPLTACVWPGWVLFTGVSCLIAMDFAARGPVGLSMKTPTHGARFFGLFQLDGLWLASAVLLAMVVWRAPLLRGWVGLCNTLAALWLRPRGRCVLLALAALLALCLGWLGYFEKRHFLHIPGLRGGGKPHITGELLRLTACAVLAWFAYRVGEWPTSARRAWLSLRGLLLVLALCGTGLLTSDDKGPLLILALAVLLLPGIPLMQSLRRRAFVIPMAVCALALTSWRFVVVQLLPSISTDVAKRILDLMHNPFRAYSPNLAQARWLMDAAPDGGFGLARVPYCGAPALVGQVPCTLGSGAPLQMASDLAYVPLYATWGAWGGRGLGGAAFVVVVCLAFGANGGVAGQSRRQ